jgi:adenosylcobyric acid synthase
MKRNFAQAMKFIWEKPSIDEKNAVNKLKSGRIDGYFLNAKTWGTYIHGIFDNQLIIKSIVKENSGFETSSAINYAAFKEEQYDKLAEHVRKNVHLEFVYETLKR